MSRNTVNLITELERRYLECNICTEVFDEEERIPRLLPCHHPFCSECIKRLGRRKETIKCPTCNAEHKVKKHGPIDFPKDNTRRDLTSFLQAHSDQNAFRKCNQCGKTVDVTYKCQQCNINLCETCQCQHQIEHETHDIIINKSETFREEQDNLDVCQNPHHERAKLKYFCISSDCQSVLCPFCVIEEHRDISKHELEDIEKAFKKRKSELGNDTKSLRTRISHVESTKQKILDKTNTLQDEKDDFLQNLDAIYNRGIADLKYRRQRLIDRYIVAFKRKESTLLTRKHNLDSFLQNASECCSLSEQLINRNSMSSFLNVHQTLDVHVKRYLNIAVEDSSCNTNDNSDTNIDFNDYLHTFDGNVELLENAKREEGLESLIEPEKGNQLECQAANSINVVGKYICNNIAILFSYFFQKVKQGVLLVISFINTILKTPFKLKQLFFRENPYTIQSYQEHSRKMRQHVMNIRRLHEGYRATGDSLEFEQYLREHIPLANCLMNSFALFWNLVLAICMFILVREITLIPLSIIEERGKLTGLKFNTQETSQFACRSADNHTVSTKPSGKMSCGSTRRLYKYEGVFANTSFLHQQESSVEFSIRFHQMSLELKEYNELPIFEFGLTNDSINTHLLLSTFFSVSGVACQNKFGVCLSIGNEVLSKSKDIFKSETNSHFAEGRFILFYQPSDLSLLFLAKFPYTKTTIALRRIQPFIFKGQLLPVFSTYTTIAVSMTIKTNQVGFDRFTLYPNLYLSDDNKTMSNKKLSGTYPSDSFGTPVIFTRPNNFRKTSTIQTKITIDFDDSNRGNSLFRLGIGKHEGGVFKRTELLECSKCVWNYLFGYLPRDGYCLSHVSFGTDKIMVGNTFSLFLHYNRRQGLIEVYIVNYNFGYSHRIFKFEQFQNQPLKVYIEKIDAKDIVISSTKNVNLLNNTYLFICLIVILSFFRN